MTLNNQIYCSFFFAVLSSFSVPVLNIWPLYQWMLLCPLRPLTIFLNYMERKILFGRFGIFGAKSLIHSKCWILYFYDTPNIASRKLSILLHCVSSGAKLVFNSTISTYVVFPAILTWKKNPSLLYESSSFCIDVAPFLPTLYLVTTPEIRLRHMLQFILK